MQLIDYSKKANIPKENNPPKSECDQNYHRTI